MQQKLRPCVGGPARLTSELSCLHTRYFASLAGSAFNKPSNARITRSSAALRIFYQAACRRSGACRFDDSGVCICRDRSGMLTDPQLFLSEPELARIVTVT